MGCRNNVLNTVISPIADGAWIDLRFLGGKYEQCFKHGNISDS